MKKRLWTRLLVACLAVIISIPLPLLAVATPHESPTSAADLFAEWGEFAEEIAAFGNIPAALIRPQFLPGVNPRDMTVIIFDGTLPWTTPLANMVNPDWTPPGGVQRLVGNNTHGFLAFNPGLFTVVAHGPLQLVRGAGMAVGTFLPYGAVYHTVVTYLHVTQEQIDNDEVIHLLIESNRRPEVLPHQFSDVEPWWDLNTQPPADHPLRAALLNDRSGLHQQRGWIHRWESMQASNSTNSQPNHHHQVRLPSYQDRYNVDGNWTIAPFPGQATNATRSSENRFALGSPVAPWTGPGHFQSPAFRGNVFCPDTGWLIGRNTERSLYQWTTHSEMHAFINELDAIAPHMWVFESGYVPHAFTFIEARDYFRVPFVVFSTTDLSAYVATNNWEGAGRAIQANGRPTVWYGAGHHGNEASAREAGLNVIHSMAATPWGASAAADVNVIIYPDYSPTSHLMHSRDSMTVSGVRPDSYAGMTGQAAFDLNRDHMTLHTQEVFLQRSVWMAFMPHIVLDGHELTGWNYTAAGVYNNADDFQISTSTTPNTPDVVIEVAGSMLRQQFADFADSGMRIAHFGNTTNPTISRPFYGHLGAASYVLETRGQVAGLQARRTYAGYLSVRSFIEYARTNSAAVTSAIDGARANIIQMGTYYDPDNNRISLHSAAISGSVDDRLPTAGEFNRFNLTLGGGYAAVAGTSLPRVGVQRDRSRPTGYVILLGDDYDWPTRALSASYGSPAGVRHDVVVPYSGVIAQLRRILDGQNIDHYFLPEGTVLPLNQYYRVSATANPHRQDFLANYRETEYVVIPAGGAYFIPMDQVQGTIIALLMEPDVRDAAATTGPAPLNAFGSSLVQIMIHAQSNNIRYDGSRTIFCCPDTMNFPIFRFTEDNPRDFVADLLAPVFSFDIFNNGPGGSPSRPNASLAEAGMIRMWTQLDGVGARIYLAAEDTVTAVDQDDECALEFVQVNRVWQDGTGWLDYFTSIDVDKNHPWQYINFSITVNGQTVDVLLVNALFEAAPSYRTVTFMVEAGAVGVYAARTITIEVPNGEEIPVSAIPNYTARTGFYFYGWVPGHPAQHGYVEEDLTFTARFNPLFHYAAFEASPGGTLEFVATWISPIRIRDGFTFWADRVPTPVPNAGYRFVGWYPANPAGFIVRESMTFTAVFEAEVSQPVFSFDIFNNGSGGSPSRPNAGLAAAGTIRMWTQLDRVNTRIPFAAAATITALDQNGDCAMRFVTVNRMWEPGGFVEYFNQVNVNRNGPWTRIYLTITVLGQTVNVVLVNS